MDRRRAAGVLLALAACIATATAAPTASNHTALDLYDGAPDGCYYNFQHYGEGDRIMTNEPCLNCTCHNRMLMCYLRVCPFTKPIGQDCTIEKRADQCCPIVTCPDVPVDLLTSTTTSPAEYGPTGIGKLDRFGCSINGKYFSEGSKVPPTPNKPCEHCYCIRNMTTCVMQECTLHVDGCTPIYHKDVCCPVRYSCDHPEDEMPLLDDLSTTVRPTPGFLLTTTTVSPVTQMSQDCVYDNRIFPDGALIKTEKACDHCYCMKGDIVCVVQECGTPMENEGKNCTALQPREGVCCPDTYICEGDEPTTGTYETYDSTTNGIQDKLTTLTPPRRTSSEGSGYRNEPDEVPYTESSILEPEIEGSGEEEESKHPLEITTDISTPGSTEDILASTEEVHEYIPLTTTKPIDEEKVIIPGGGEDESMVTSGNVEKVTESQSNLPSTTVAYSIKETDDLTTDKTEEDIGSGDLPEDISLKPHEEIPVTPGLSITEESVVSTEIPDQDTVTSAVTERQSSATQIPSATVPIEEDKKPDELIVQDMVTSDLIEKTTSKLPIEHDVTSSLEESTEPSEYTEPSIVKSSETPNVVTTSLPIIENEIKETTESLEQHIISISDDINRDTTLEPQQKLSSTSALPFDDDFVTTEYQEHEMVTESVKETEYFGSQPHITASTPMLEEIEKDTTEYIEPERVDSSNAPQDDAFHILSTTVSSDLSAEMDKEDVTKPIDSAEHTTSEDQVPSTTNIPEYDQQDRTTAEPIKISELPTEPNVKEDSKLEELSPSTTTPVIDENGRRTTQLDLAITSAHDSNQLNLSSTTISSSLDNAEATTEPDKGLNTIPSDLIEDIPASSEGQKTTMTDEKITTESDLDTRFGSSTESITTPSIPTIIPDASVSKTEPSTLTTEPAFRKEDYSPTEDQDSAKLTSVTVSVTEEETSTLSREHTKSPESVLNIKPEIVTTPEPKYTENIEDIDTTLVKESTIAPSYEPSTPKGSLSEKDLITEEILTSTPLYEKSTETTTVNQEDNEIFNEPRIPGEGDCLLNGITYTNESTVPSTNKCQSGCKCISSIIKCDPIICSPPPEYMDNCETMYDTPDACCPTYICDHKTETIPPQSHSQMSGTEAPGIPTVQCHGDECEISEDKKHNEEPADACKLGTCTGSSNEPQETSSVSPAGDIPEQPVSEQKEKCTDDKCTPVICTDENGCQASPVTPCEGEKCDVKPDVILPSEPQKCADGENCLIPDIPTEECSAGNCGAAQTEKTHSKEECKENEGCQNVPMVSEEECIGDECKKKDSSPLDKKVPESCNEPNCKQIQTQMGASTLPAAEQTSQDVIDKDKENKPVETTATTEELHVIVTNQPDITSDETSTTIADDTAIITKLEPEQEVTTKSSEFTYQQEVTSQEFVTDENENKLAESTEMPAYSSPKFTETTIKDHETKITSSYDITTKTPTADEFITQDQEIKTEHPQETSTMETPTLDVTYQEGTTQTVTESDEKNIPDDASHITLEGAATESSKLDTLQPHDITESLTESDKETATETAKDSSIEPQTTLDSNKLPNIAKHTDTTTAFSQEISTEPSKTYVTESQEMTGTPKDIYQEDITNKVTVESITEPTKPEDKIKQEEFTKETSETSGTEVATEKLVDKVDQSESSSKLPEDFGTETSTTLTSIDFQSVTVKSEDIDQHSSTIKTTEEITYEPSKPITLEPQDITLSPQQVDTSSSVTKEPSETISTDSLEITTPSQKLDQITTIKDYDTDLNDITKSPQDLNEENITEKIADDSLTESPKVYSTEATPDIQSPEKVEPKDTTITATSTDQTYVTQPKSTEYVYEDITTAKILDELRTEPPRRYDDTEQDITKSPENIDHEDTTLKITEEPPKPIVTETQEVFAEVDQKDTTSKIFDEPGTKPPIDLSTEQQEATKSSEDIDRDEITKTLEDITTEPPKLFETKPQEVAKLPEELDEKDTTTTKIPVTEPQITKTEDVFTSSVDTTTQIIIESGTEPSKTQGEILYQPEEKTKAPGGSITEGYVEIETSNPTTIDVFTEKPKEDKEKPQFIDAEISEDITTQESLPLEPIESTTKHPLAADSKEQEVSQKETTVIPSYDNESQSLQTDVEDTESSVKEQVSSVSTPRDTAVTVTPVISDSDKKHEDSEPDTVTEGFESHTAISPSGEPAEVSQPDLKENESTEQATKAPTIEKDVLEPIDTEIQVPAYIPTDELRTTSEIYGTTTLIPIESSQEPQGIEIKTEYPDNKITSQEEHHQDPSTEEPSAGTETPSILEEIKTAKPVTVNEEDYTKQTESQTSSPQTDGEPTTIEGENYTVEPISKYSTPEPTVASDSTKVYHDEEMSTTKPIVQESEEPEKPVDDLVQSLITKEDEISTKPYDVEKESHTKLPALMPSETTDKSQPSEPHGIEDNLTTPSSKLPDTAFTSYEDKSTTSTEYAVPVKEEETRTESDLVGDKTTSESTTLKENLSEEDAITQKSSAPDEIEIDTKKPELIPSVDVTAATDTTDTLFTEKQESTATDKPSVDMHEYLTESSYITETPTTKITNVDQPLPEDQKHTESEQEGPKVTDIQIEKQTEPSDIVSEVTPAVSVTTKLSVSESATEDQASTSEDQIKSEDIEINKNQPELTTLRPTVEYESSSFEPTTAPKDEQPESMSSSFDDAEHKDKTDAESAVTPMGEELSTEITKTIESMPEAYTEKQPESIQTEAPAKETPMKEYLTTRKQFEPEGYQTTLSVMEDISEMSTLRPMSAENESTTEVYDITPVDEHKPPTEEQSIPVVISDKEKTSPEESIVVQTERVTVASEKPLQETTAPEEEFILATSKATTVKAEDEISTMSPTSDKTIKPTDEPVELPIATEIPVTAAPETPIATEGETAMTTVPVIPLPTVSEPVTTSAPENTTTKASEAPITLAPEASVTTLPEIPVTVEPESAVTKTPDASIPTAPASQVTTAPEVPKPVSTEAQPTDEAPIPDEEGSFPPSAGTSGYGQEPDYVEEDQTFGPGTCRYGGKVYVSAQQIPRDDPCDFCFCFRSDIICLQQSCPPPIHGCHEEPIQGFCCPRYECPVSMATTVNVTTTTTTTTTTLPPHFPTHSYKGSVQKRGCQIKGQTYKVGEVVRASSGPCLHCTCGGDGQMKCDPKVCTPEPMLRQMIAAAVSAKRRR